MAQVPEIRFAQNDGVHIAYQALGSGEADILLYSTGVLPIDAMDEEPALARFQNRLASYGRLIRFDAPGVGMSDPMTLTDPTTLEQWVEDAVAVLDAVGSKRATVVAPRDASLQGILLAATFPDRVAGLVIINGTARMARAEDYPIGIPHRIMDRFLEVNMEPDAVARGFDFLASAAPSVAHDQSFRDWWVKAGYRGASPTAARAVQAAYMWADVRSVLPFVRVPTLVLHRRDNDFIRVSHGRYLGEHIPGARYVELDGADDLYWVGDTDLMLDEIEEFLTGARHGPRDGRTLATILFTDIVGSTARLAELGDRKWRELLERNDQMLRRQLARFGGRHVNTTGDGLLATFDGPARAVTCACAIRDGAAQLGLELRAGIHTGEVETHGADIAGLAVHLAARVQSLADPGEVLASRTVVDLVAGSGIVFADRGLHELRGVPGTWRLFSVGS